MNKILLVFTFALAKNLQIESKLLHKTKTKIGTDVEGGKCAAGCPISWIGDGWCDAAC